MEKPDFTQQQSTTNDAIVQADALAQKANEQVQAFELDEAMANYSDALSL